MLDEAKLSQARERRSWIPVGLLAFVCFAIGMIETQYVGNATIYRESLATKRLQVHDSILYNRQPERGWDLTGTNSTNVRVMCVYLAEALERYVGVSVLKAYKAIDLVFIAVTLFLSFWFFRSMTTSRTALIAMLYLAAILPLTYANHYFHPWDRTGWLFWLLAIWAVRERQPWLLAIVVGIGVTNKIDILAAAGLYFLVWTNRSNWPRITITTALISILGICVSLLLRCLFPGGADAEREYGLVLWIKSLSAEFQAHPLDHPAFLAFTPLLCLAPFGLSGGSRFAIASFAYGVFLLFYISITHHFIEIRAQMGFMLLLIPLAIAGLDRLLSCESASSNR